MEARETKGMIAIPSAVLNDAGETVKPTAHCRIRCEISSRNYAVLLNERPLALKIPGRDGTLLSYDPGGNAKAQPDDIANLIAQSFGFRAKRDPRQCDDKVATWWLVAPG